MTLDPFNTLLEDALRAGIAVGCNQQVAHFRPRDRAGLYVWRDMMAVPDNLTNAQYCAREGIIEGEDAIRDYLGLTKPQRHRRYCNERTETI